MRLGAQERPRYRHADAALVRAVAHASDVIPDWWPGMDGTDAEQWRAWLHQVWSHAPAAEAISIASPVLAARVQAVCSGERPGIRQVRRMALSVARYLLRMTGRATPFGVFAGVAPARFGPLALVRWASGPQAVARADAIWLADVIARLESCSALRQRLPVVLNDLSFTRGGRLVVRCQSHAAEPGRSTCAEISVHCTRAVQAAAEATRSPIRAGDLIRKLAAEFPAAPAPAIESMVAELVTRGFLITSLRPPSTSTDGMRHLLDRLDGVLAAELDEAAPLAPELRVIQAELTASSGTGWADGQARRAVSDRMRKISDAAVQPLMVDLRLGCAVVLPVPVAAEAEAAATALFRLTPYPTGIPGWQDYHARFLNRYGAAALIPVRELTDPTAGLGFPAHYRGSGRPAVPSGLSERDERLLALAQQATLDGAREIVLDDAAIEELAPGGTDQAQPAAHVELCAEVRALTLAALTDGAFTLAVTGVSRTAAAMASRFLDILPDGDRERLTSLYGSLPTEVDGALPAQLSFPPLNPRTANVVRAPVVLPAVISLAEHAGSGPDHLPVADLAITADNDRLYVVSLSRRQVVEPMVAHAAALDNMPPIARFLFEIPRARAAVVAAFDWGAAARLPFLPRVRYGRAVLAPARFRLPASALPGPAAPWPEWSAAMAALRRRLHLPGTVHTGAGDRRLRLNLDDPMHLAVLRAQLDGAQHAAALSEASFPSDNGWFADRAHELVIPLIATGRPACPPPMLNMPGPLPVIGREHGQLPGSQILFAKLYGHPDLHDTILTGHLPALLSAWEETPVWWFVRYRDPAPHLRLRLHLASAGDYGQAASRVGAWAADLRRRGLIGDLTLDTYHPETGRYGTGAAMAAAEAVFAADSAAVLAQLAARPTRTVHPDALTAASMTDLAAGMTGGLAAGMAWLINHPDAGPAMPCDREARRQAVALADPGEDRAALRAIPGGPQVAAAWQLRRGALAAYRHRLQDAASVEPDPALASLLHLHHVRANGISPDTEHRCRRLARSAALAWAARHQTTEGAVR